MQDEEFGREYARKQTDRQRNPFRRLIKSLYVSRVLKHVTGPAVDLGCGAGQILERLPKGSIGVEVNPHLVESLTQRGLHVIPAVPAQDGFNLMGLKPNEFDSLVLSHVLEHFNNAGQVLRKLLRDCDHLGISTVIIVVPSETGFRSDSTHKTFVDLNYLQTHQLVDCEGYRIAHYSYFPLNFKFIGKLFVYHELMIVYRTSRGT